MAVDPKTIHIDESRNANLTPFARGTLDDRYLLPDETYQGMFARVSAAYADDEEHAQRLYDYMSQQWFMPATPVLSNGGAKRGLPISCFLNRSSDSLEGIVGLWDENVWLAANGGGIGSYWGDLRGVGEKVSRAGTTSGIIPFVKVMDSMTLAISQGCVDGKTEILTEKGWIRFDQLGEDHGRVAQVDDEGSISFVTPIEYHEYEHSGTMHHYENHGTFDHLVTPNHRMVYETLVKRDGKREWTGRLVTRESIDHKPHRDNRFYTTGVSSVDGKASLSPRERFLIAYQADGSTNPSGTSTGEKSGTLIFAFRFKRKRKIERFEEILSLVGYEYSLNVYENDVHSYLVRVPVDEAPSKFFHDWVDLTGVSGNWSREFIHEMKEWDGSTNEKNTIRFDCVDKVNADFVCAIACLGGFKAFQAEKERPEPRRTLYKVHICEDRRTVGGESITKTQVEFSGKVYCVSVPSGMFLCRRNGKTVVTGNSLRRGSAAVYLQVNHPEIKEFLEIRKPTGGDTNRKALNLHHAVCITDEFMEAVTKGQNWDLVSPKDGTVRETVSARSLWQQILTMRIETGEPYLLFLDNVNKALPDHQKKLGHEVVQSNLCVAPETKVMTINGNFEIQKLEDEDVKVWNGEEWSEVTIKRTSDWEELMMVEFISGKFLECTVDHEFWVIDGWGEPTKRKAKDLNRNDILDQWYNPKTGEVEKDIIKNTERRGRFDATYCFTEHKRHRGMFNGIVTGQCAEITLFTGKDFFEKLRTAVCCLSSVNYEFWDIIKDLPMFLEDVMRFLDNVLDDFINRAPPEMEKAIYSARMERSVGLGAMGIHGLFMQKNIPFESALATSLNRQIFQWMKEGVDAANKKLADERGPCPDAKAVGVHKRFSNCTAIAPTASISIIADATPSIEPIRANVYTQKTLAGSFTVKNKWLKRLLAEKGQDTAEIWASITRNSGSVQHLSFLNEWEKDVFKTAIEIDQSWIIEHAAERTPLIDQSQSVNLFFKPDVSKSHLNKVHFSAWKKGLKSLYYCRSESIRRAEGIGELVERQRLPEATEEDDSLKYDDNGEECLSCQ